MRLIPRSLKKQLLLSLLCSLFAIWGATTYAIYRQTRSEIAELLNAELAQSARVVHAFVENMLHKRTLAERWDEKKSPELFFINIIEHKYERKIAFQLRSVRDGIVLRSESAPEFALSLTRNGYSDTVVDDRLWHVFSISSESGEYVIHVGQRDDIRQELAQRIASEQILVFLIAFPVLGLLIWLIVRRTLRPINRLRADLARREANNLQPLAIGKLPEELTPVVEQLNSLFAMLEQALENERNFTSDASHELRTPLAGLSTQIQVALKTDDDSVRRQALQRGQQAIARMSHMVQQLLTLSRVQHQKQRFDLQIVDAHQALINSITELEPYARDKRIELSLDGPDKVMLCANPQLLAILLRNLIDNAIKYTPVDGNIEVRLHSESNKLTISVADSGCGVAEDELKRISQRFYRCADTANRVDGCGLGLSIVQRIVALHDAEISFGHSPLGGLQVMVSFLPA